MLAPVGIGGTMRCVDDLRKLRKRFDRFGLACPSCHRFYPDLEIYLARRRG